MATRAFDTPQASICDLREHEIKVVSENDYFKALACAHFRNLGKKDQSNDRLQKQIRHAIGKTKSNKVKPNYRKKVSKAVDLVKLKHRKKVVLTNIARSGGNARDFHSDEFAPRRGKK